MDRPLTDARVAPGARRRRGRRSAWMAVLLGVLLVHALGVYWLRDALDGWGVGKAPALHRMDVAFVQALAPAAPPPVAASPAPVVRPLRSARASTAARPASAPAAAESPAEPASAPVGTPLAPADVTLASGPAPLAEAAPAASSATSVAEGTSAALATAPQAAGFEWPPSTRLTYSLVGNYRGDVQGSAVVQWIRDGPRYQVHLDVFIGPSFAPLMSRRMTSDGELGPGGLAPQRYEETTKVAFQSPRRAIVQFAPGLATLANGSTRDVPATVQDTASQFVQLTWLFTTQPALLTVGRTVEVPLALPRRTDRWLYEVVAQERLVTPVGEVDAFHLKPRRAEQRPRGELSAEVWFAPALQYLPVRIRIQQDADTYVDLTLDAAPMQAAPERPR